MSGKEHEDNDCAFLPLFLLSAQMTTSLAYLVLSIDGGGFKGLACLRILAHLMAQISGGDDEVSPRPCQVFDLICGTSTGGLIAILLGRFGLSCEEAIEVYRDVGETMFDGETDSRKMWEYIIKGGQLPSERFEEKLEDLTAKYTGSKDALFRPLKTAPDTVDHDSTKVRLPPLIECMLTSVAFENTIDLRHCRVENRVCRC